MLITRPITAWGVCACTSVMFRFVKKPAFQPVVNMIASERLYQGERPRAPLRAPPKMSVTMK